MRELSLTCRESAAYPNLRRDEILLFLLGRTYPPTLFDQIAHDSTLDKVYADFAR